MRDVTAIHNPAYVYSGEYSDFDSTYYNMDEHTAQARRGRVVSDVMDYLTDEYEYPFVTVERADGSLVTIFPAGFCDELDEYDRVTPIIDNGGSGAVTFTVAENVYKRDDVLRWLQSSITSALSAIQHAESERDSLDQPSARLDQFIASYTRLWNHWSLVQARIGTLATVGT